MAAGRLQDAGDDDHRRECAEQQPAEPGAEVHDQHEDGEGQPEHPADHRRRAPRVVPGTPRLLHLDPARTRHAGHLSRRSSSSWGSACAIRPRNPVVVVAISKELSRASSTASIPAAKTGVSSASGGGQRFRGAERDRRSRRCHGRTTPRPGPSRRSPRRASRPSWRASSGASVASTIMQEPPAGSIGVEGSTLSAGSGVPSTVSRAAEVRLHQPPPDGRARPVPSTPRTRCRSRPCSRARPSRCRRRRSPPRAGPPDAPWRASRMCCLGDRPGPDVRQVSVVRLADDRVHRGQVRGRGRAGTTPARPRPGTPTASRSARSASRARRARPAGSRRRARRTRCRRTGLLAPSDSQAGTARRRYSSWCAGRAGPRSSHPLVRPTSTPGTSVIAFNGPAGTAPGTIPSSRARISLLSRLYSVPSTGRKR